MKSRKHWKYKKQNLFLVENPDIITTVNFWVCILYKLFKDKAGIVSAPKKWKEGLWSNFKLFIKNSLKWYLGNLDILHIYTIYHH